MGAVRIAVLVVAAIAAIGLAFVVNRMVSHRPAPVAPVAAAPVAEHPTVQVVVAKRDLPVGTRITQADLGWQPWPAEAVNPTFITDGNAPAPPPTSPTAKLGATAAQAAQTAFNGGGGAMQALEGAIVREPILSNEPVVERKIVHGGSGGYMAVVLQPGMRAISMPVTVETAAGGFILPGDRVDVVSTRKVDQQGGGGGGSVNAVSETILQNVRVLAIDQQVQPDKAAKTIVGTTATLEVPGEDVELLTKAKAQGDLALSLRSYADMGGPAGRADGSGRSTSVRVIRAGHVSEVTAR